MWHGRSGQGGKAAAKILELETALARFSGPGARPRSRQNLQKTAISELPALMPGYDWQRILRSSGLEGKVDYVNSGPTDILYELSKVLSATPLGYGRRISNGVCCRPPRRTCRRPSRGTLAFTGGVLRGVPENQARWNAHHVLDASLGEAAGKLYVAKYFPPRIRRACRRWFRTCWRPNRRDIDTSIG